MSHFSISKGIMFEGEEKATINITIDIACVSDAPPALNYAINGDESEIVAKVMAVNVLGVSLPKETRDQVGQALLDYKQSESEGLSEQLSVGLETES